MIFQHDTEDSVIAGTRFLIYPQPPILNPEAKPEVVVVSSPAGSIKAGPEDFRMYTINPIGKWPPYGMHTDTRDRPYMYLPPWDGDVSPPAEPDQNGHFDHLDIDSKQFEAAHLFGCVRFVLDIWEEYFGHEIPWHFGNAYQKMELVNLPSFDNGHIGYGFLEVGSNLSKDKVFTLDCTNFDVIAHEVGHGIIYSMVGVPDPERETGEYNGFHESAADLVAIISCLHFESVIDELLANTRGNLYMLNRLNRIAELSENEQIRIASNSVTMSEFADGWRKEHRLSQPLTGAIFDILVDLFHEELVDLNLISQELEESADRYEYRPEYQKEIQSLFDDAFEGQNEGFKAALIGARDILGKYLAELWRRLPPNDLTYELIGNLLIEIDQDLSNGRYADIIDNNFYYREIGQFTVGPQLAKLPKENHMDSSRRLTPDKISAKPFRKRSYKERWHSAGQLD